MNNEEECATCQFFYERLEPEKSDLGRCKRFPPIASHERKHADIWPLVSYASWCGEYRRNRDNKDPTL